MLWNILLVSLVLAVALGLFAPPQPLPGAYELCKQSLCLSGAALVVALLFLCAGDLDSAIIAGSVCEIFFMAAVWLSACSTACRRYGGHLSRRHFPEPRIDWDAFNHARAQWSEESRH